jgi:hypothetical protein
MIAQETAVCHAALSVVPLAWAVHSTLALQADNSSCSDIEVNISWGWWEQLQFSFSGAAVCYGHFLAVGNASEYCRFIVTFMNFQKDQYRHCTLKRAIEARSCNHFCCQKAISITYSECVSVALVVQRACRVILWCVSCLGLPCVSTVSLKRHDYPQ